jgi:hypothetical protein
LFDDLFDALFDARLDALFDARLSALFDALLLVLESIFVPPVILFLGKIHFFGAFYMLQQYFLQSFLKIYIILIAIGETIHYNSH